jgi:site-specific DNA-methyltransferase (adenine-specific)
LIPYYESGGITIYNADCRDVLPTLGPVDHVITDPPYEAEAHTLQRRTKETFAPQVNGVDMRPATVKAVDFDPMTAELRQFTASECARLTKRWALVFCQAEAVGEWKRALVCGGLSWRRPCVWVKPDGQPQLTGDRPSMGYESIACAHAEGRSRWNGGGRLGVFTVATKSDPDSERTGHVTQKPLKLMTLLVSLFTDPGETILDPFGGSGTTARAAKDLGRNCVLIEREEKWAEIAANRMSQEVLL